MNLKVPKKKGATLTLMLRRYIGHTKSKKKKEGPKTAPMATSCTNYLQDLVRSC